MNQAHKMILKTEIEEVEEIEAENGGEALLVL